ncbi:flagellar biosynthesis protein [Streptohalobacillus salinus]|uniref:Flagellar biosynthesis protein n=1 Tax=Streptohalobacillus salinus TaxID=621096 RepID=A0A2V3WGL2_9BACI|nr:EscU/YscU/HrcU family type III secretion system export apparatus switch protein [Streptohalobacillus salinus]PXW92544.1 flagellar biosynthesis protein [Streptohalobacillus salinus]
MTKKYNPKSAIALKYDQEKHQAPMVTAKGKGYVAEEIIKRAKDANVPIQEDQSLIEMLANINVNDKIPEELYQAVAEVFAFIYRVDQQIKQK